MADPVVFVGANLPLGPPPGRPDVRPIQVFRNRACLVSCWQLSEAELAEIVRTGRVYLAVMGFGMPPVFVASESEMRAFTVDAGPLPKQAEQPLTPNPSPQRGEGLKGGA